MKDVERRAGDKPLWKHIEEKHAGRIDQPVFEHFKMELTQFFPKPQRRKANEGVRIAHLDPNTRRVLPRNKHFYDSSERSWGDLKEEVPRQKWWQGEGRGEGGRSRGHYCPTGSIYPWRGSFFKNLKFLESEISERRLLSAGGLSVDCTT